MRRTFTVTERFIFERALYVVPSTRGAIALSKEIGRLVHGVLPGPEDFRALMPVVGVVWVRGIVGASMWLYYDFSDESLAFYSLTTREPIRFD